MSYTLRSHQIQAKNFIQHKDAFALFMDMGTGKSLVILDKLLYLYEQGLVDKMLLIVPNYLKDPWYTDVLNPFCEIPFKHFIYDGDIKSKKGNYEFTDFCNYAGLKIMIVNVEAFSSDTVNMYIRTFMSKKDLDCFIVVDESVIIKNPAAKRTTNILKGFSKRKYKAILSGTPTPKSPCDLWSQFEFLKANYFNCNYFTFLHRHTIQLSIQLPGAKKPFNQLLQEEDYNRIKRDTKEKLTEESLLALSLKYKTSERNILAIKNMERYTPYKDLDKLNDQISNITFKVLKKDCIDLPEKIYESIIVELSAEQKRIYKELKRYAYATYHGKELTALTKQVITLRLRMINSGLFPYLDFNGMELLDENVDINDFKKVELLKENPKLDALKNDIENVDSDTQIIVWSYFVETIKYITNELNRTNPTESFYGAVDKNDRTKRIENFKNANTRILVMNPLVGGMGLNLQNATLHYFFDDDYRPDVRAQAEDRTHRLGLKQPVVYKDIIMKGTVDERIAEVRKQKMTVIDYFKSHRYIEQFL